MPTIATVQVFDFETFSGDATNVNPANASGALITATLNYNQVNSVSPQANLQAVRVSTLTDTTGRWQLNLIPNNNINPANTLWTISTPTQSYQISVPGTGPVQSSTIKVASPVTLTPASSTTGPLTVQGLLAAQAGEVVSGGVLNAQAGLTVAGAVNLPAGSVGVAALNGILSIANGGTGSATQNFVDLSTAQTIGGAKTFTAGLVGNGGTTLRPAAANQVGVIVQGQPSQTSDFFQVMTNATVVLFKVDSTGALTLGGHFLAASAQPTLGALQTNVTSQSIAGNDVRGGVTVTIGAAAVTAAAALAVVTFATAYSGTPSIFVSPVFSSTATYGSMQVLNPSATGFTIANGSTNQSNLTFTINYWVIG